MSTMSDDSTAEKRLLAAVVAQAIKDACLAPIVRERRRKKEIRLKGEAATAMAFLFDDERSGVDAYALWLDFDVEQFRKKLINKCSSDAKDPYLNDDQKRNFRRNYRLFKSLPSEYRNLIDTEEYEE